MIESAQTGKDLRKPMLKTGEKTVIDGKVIDKIELRSYLRRKRVDQICAQCGKPFVTWTTNGSGRKYCTPACERIANPSAFAPKYPREVTTKCGYCKKTFTYTQVQSNSPRKFCTDECRQSSNREAAEQRALERRKAKGFDRTIHCIREYVHCVHYSDCQEERLIHKRPSLRYTNKGGNCFEAPKINFENRLGALDTSGLPCNLNLFQTAINSNISKFE